MNKYKYRKTAKMDLEKVSIFIFVIALIFTAIALRGTMMLMFNEVDFNLKNVLSALGPTIIAGLAFYYCLYIDQAKNKLINELMLESELIGFMYQQYDTVDLTVFSQKYFLSEDEVLNFILTTIPHWFINATVEFLYESIKEGYLYKRDNKHYITSDPNEGHLKVYYISNI
jgi:hypothetical protein